MNNFVVRNGNIIYRALSYGYGTKGKFIDVWNEDLLKHNFTNDTFKGRMLTVDFRAEGINEEQAEPLISYLISALPDTEIFVIYNTVLNSVPTYDHRVDIDYMSAHLDFTSRIILDPKLDIDKKFLCLIRRPSPSRAKIAANLENNPNVRLSFGTGSQSEELEKFKPMFVSTLPILIDGATPGLEQHTHLDPVFYKSLFNIIVETSSQEDVGSWTSIFITEKTFKAFAFRQIPIWFAVPGLVKKVKELGFDIFEDIIDHSYDSIQDEQTRHLTVLEQINQLDTKFGLEDCQELRHNLRQRFQNNFDLLMKKRDFYKYKL